MLYAIPPPLWLFARYSKNLKATDFCCGCPYEEKKSKNLVLPPLRALLIWVGKIAHRGEGEGKSLIQISYMFLYKHTDLYIALTAHLAGRQKYCQKNHNFKENVSSSLVIMLRGKIA